MARLTETQAREAVFAACWNVGEAWATMALTTHDVSTPLEAELPGVDDRLLRDREFCAQALKVMRESALRATNRVKGDSPPVTLH
jgi:hypothetical protein